jgi:hypothetical protein
MIEHMFDARQEGVGLSQPKSTPTFKNVSR